MRVLGIVPARAGSKRLPGKNLRVIGGRPLVARAIEAALAARSLAEVVVSSDDPAVLAIAEDYPTVRRVPRPAELATDTAPAIGYVRHALALCEQTGDPRFEAVAILQPSSPFTEAADIDGTVALLASSGADSAVTVVKLDHAIHPVKLKTMQGDRLLPWWEEERGRMAAHELPELWVRNCAVYASRRSVVDAGEVIGADCRGYPMPRERSVDINDELDLALAEFLASRSEA